MSVSCCLLKALDIGRKPRTEWKAAIKAIPAECPCASICTGGIGCRERVAAYMRMQWNMMERRAARQGGRR